MNAENSFLMNSFLLLNAAEDELGQGENAEFRPCSLGQPALSSVWV